MILTYKLVVKYTNDKEKISKYYKILNFAIHPRRHRLSSFVPVGAVPSLGSEPSALF
jgi:hypothetical protein